MEPLTAGFPDGSWKVLDFWGKIFRTRKVLENDFGPEKSWKFKLQVLESLGICWDMDAMMQTRKYSRPHT